MSYIFGWGVLGTVMVLTLIGYGYGIEMLQLQLPQFNVEVVNIVSAMVGLIVSILSFAFFFRKILAYRKHILKLSSEVKVSMKKFTDAFSKLKMESMDLNDQLILLRRDLEREILKLARMSGITKSMKRHVPLTRLMYVLMDERILSASLGKTILFVYQECSKAVHGEILSDKDARLIRELGLKSLIALREITKKSAKK